MMWKQQNAGCGPPAYTYDDAGNRTSKTNYLNGVTENYAYDPLYQLLQVTQGGSTTETYRRAGPPES